MLPADSFLPLKHLFSSLLCWSGSVCAVLPSLGLFLSLGKFKWHYLSARMIGPIRFSVNKRRAEAQQEKKQFLKGFPKSLILCFCHVTFSRFVCREMHHVWMETALTSTTISPCQKHSPYNRRGGVQWLSWDLQIIVCKFDAVHFKLKLSCSHRGEAWNTYNVLQLLIIAFGLFLQVQNDFLVVHCFCVRGNACQHVADLNFFICLW